MSQISLKAEEIEVKEQWKEPLIFWCKELYHIFKSKYVETVALKNLNLKIFRNEFLGILGASGSGKTTLLKILAGLLPCTTGRIYFRPEIDQEILNFTRTDYDERTLIRRNYIGYISQEPFLFDYLTIDQNLEIPFLIRKNGLIEHDKIDTILKDCGIEHRREYKIDQLSGGEKQRVQIAMALVTNPKIIIADEPTANLDRKNAENIFQLLQEMNHKYQTTIILVTHDQTVKKYASQVMTILDGQILEMDN